MAEHDEDAATIEGSAPGGVGVLIIDMINDLRFEGAQDLWPKVDAVASAVLGLRDRADRLGVPVVYVNDNYGRWRSDRSKIVEAGAAAPGPGGALVRRMAPRPGDYFVIKPEVSGFYATTLPVLLPRLGVSRLVLTGIAADICVLFTAADAHMREYELWVPRDMVAGQSDQRTEWALAIMRDAFDAETRGTDELPLEDWVARKRQRSAAGPRPPATTCAYP
jgi:nicotinamidase-related amidase